MKNRKFIDTNFYREFSIIMSEFYQPFKNFEKELKFTIGQRTIELILECIEYMVLSYRYDKPAFKISCAEETLKCIDKIESLIQLCFELKQINTKKMSQLVLHIGNVKIQIENWINSNRHKLADSKESRLDENGKDELDKDGYLHKQVQSESSIPCR